MGAKILKNIIYQFADRIVTMIINFATLIILTRSLSIDLFGELSFVQNYIYGFITFTDLGVNTILLRELAAGKKTDTWILERALILKIALAILTFGAAMITIFLLNYSIQVLLGSLLYGLVLLLAPFDLLITWFQAELKSKTIVWTNSVSSIICFLLTLAVVWFGGNLLWLMLTLLLQTLLRYSLIYLVFQKYKKPIGLRIDLDYSWFLLKQTIPLTVTSLLLSFTANSTIVLLSKSGNAQEVAFFNISNRFYPLLSFLPQAVMSAVFPVISRYYSEANGVSLLKLEKLYKNLTYYFLLLAIPIAIITTVFAPQIVELIFTNKYNGAAPTFQLMVWFVCIQFIGVTAGQTLIAIGYQKVYAFIHLIGTLLLLCSSLILIPLFKAAGLALAYIVFQTLVVVLLEVAIYRYLKVKRNMPIGWRWLALVGLSGSSCWIISGFPIVLALGLSLALYIFWLLLLKMVLLQDLVKIKSLLFHKEIAIS